MDKNQPTFDSSSLPHPPSVKRHFSNLTAQLLSLPSTTTTATSTSDNNNVTSSDNNNVYNNNNNQDDLPTSSSVSLSLHSPINNPNGEKLEKMVENIENSPSNSTTSSTIINNNNNASPLYLATSPPFLSSSPFAHSPAASSTSVLSFTTGFINSIRYPTALIRYSDLSIVHCNDSACDLFGYSLSDMHSMKLSSLFPGIKKKFCRQVLTLFNSDTPSLLSSSSTTISTTTATTAQDSKSPIYSYSYQDDYRRPSAPITSSYPYRTHRRNISLQQSSSSSSVRKNDVSRLIKARQRDGTFVWVELSLSEISNDTPISSGHGHHPHHFLHQHHHHHQYNKSSEYVTSPSSSDHYLLATIRELSKTERSSRYHAEFDELAVVGKGGYGIVYRARNKIDGQEYAIKKVRLENQYASLDTNDKFIREVQTFARISNHPNVVRYYAAWTEPDFETESEDGDSCDHSMSDLDEHENEVSTNMDTEIEFTVDNFKHEISLETTAISRPKSLNSPIIKLRKPKKPKKYSKSYNNENDTLSPPLPEGVMLQQELLLGKALKNSNNTHSSSHSHSHSSSKPKKKAAAILYIQMQLCPYNDLRRWIENHPEVNTDASFRIFRQIVEGTNHIHQKGFVHRDIKPENIFIQDDHVFLGDFGLAKSIMNKVIPLPLRSSKNAIIGISAKSIDVSEEEPSSEEAGTFLYCAPEYHSNKMTTKTDVFSLGVILLELLVRFQTKMERAVVLTEAKRGILPKELESRKKEGELLRNLLNPNPKERLSTTEILKVLDSWNDICLSGHLSDVVGDSSGFSSPDHSLNSSENQSKGLMFNSKIFVLPHENSSDSQTRKGSYRRWSSVDTLSSTLKVDRLPGASSSSSSSNKFHAKPPTVIELAPIFSSPFSSPIKPTNESPLSQIKSSFPSLSSSSNNDIENEGGKIRELEQEVDDLKKQLEEMKTMLALKDLEVSQLRTSQQNISAHAHSSCNGACTNTLDCNLGSSTSPKTRRSARSSLLLSRTSSDTDLKFTSSPPSTIVSYIIPKTSK